MSFNRKLTSTYTPAAQQGFLGAGHTARALIQRAYSDSDPFILLMDDVLDKQDDEPAGGPHPHAGFETVSLLLEGEIGDAAHRMKGGDFQLMTAGSGVIHTETIEKKAKMRLLQLWLTLPKKYRWTTPRVQDLRLEHVPTLSQDGVEISLYSGSLSGLTSPVKNHVPLILADIKLQAATAHTLEFPASYNSFLYVLEGSVSVGSDENPLSANQVGWLNRYAENIPASLELRTGDRAARLVLYAGEPQGDPIVSHGPFIGDTQEDIHGLYRAFRQGKMKHITSVPEQQRLLL